VKKTTRFVIWICSKFTHREIEQIIQGLIEVLANRNPDGNPSYPAGIHFINQNYEPNLTHKKVVGLQNLDKESEEFRPFKELY